MKPENDKRVVGAASAEAILIEKRLRQLAVNQVCSYAELNALIPGADVSGAQRYYLVTAMRRCEADGIFVRTVPKDGVKRVSDGDETLLWRIATDRSRRMTRRAARRLARVDYEKLSDPEKRQYNIGLSITSTLAAFLKPARVEAIADEVGHCARRLNFDETLELFRKTTPTGNASTDDQPA